MRPAWPPTRCATTPPGTGTSPWRCSPTLTCPPPAPPRKKGVRCRERPAHRPDRARAAAAAQHPHPRSTAGSGPRRRLVLVAPTTPGPGPRRPPPRPRTDPAITAVAVLGAGAGAADEATPAHRRHPHGRTALRGLQDLAVAEVDRDVVDGRRVTGVGGPEDQVAALQVAAGHLGQPAELRAAVAGNADP